jgi:hypothetical protein
MEGKIITVSYDIETKEYVLYLENNKVISTKNINRIMREEKKILEVFDVKVKSNKLRK